jgi:hypothetical protein
LWIPVTSTAIRTSRDPDTIGRARRLRSWCRAQLHEEIDEREVHRRVTNRRRRAFLRSLVAMSVPAHIGAGALLGLTAPPAFVLGLVSILLAAMVARQRRAAHFTAILDWGRSLFYSVILVGSLVAPLVALAYRSVSVYDYAAIAFLMLLQAIAIRFPTQPRLSISALLDPDDALPTDVAESLDDAARDIAHP